METIRGIFVPFDDEEEQEIMAEFHALGYEWDGKGIKKFLTDALFNQEKEQTLGETLAEALKRNPSAPLNALDLGLYAFKKMRENLR
jgi:hypothetical protein